MPENQSESSELLETRALHNRILARSQELSRLRDKLPAEVLRAMEHEISRLQSELDQRVADETESSD